MILQDLITATQMSFLVASVYSYLVWLQNCFEQFIYCYPKFIDHSRIFKQQVCLFPYQLSLSSFLNFEVFTP